MVIFEHHFGKYNVVILRMSKCITSLFKERSGSHTSANGMIERFCEPTTQSTFQVLNWTLHILGLHVSSRTKAACGDVEESPIS
jgi:hypothetical protein